MYRLLIISGILLALTEDGLKDGRRGNELHRQGNYAEAAEAYRSAIASSGQGSSILLSRLYNNLALTLNRMGEFSEAAPLFDQAVDAGASDEDRVRSAYNAGNNAFMQQHLEDALDYYRRTLLSSPDHDDARFNYEFVKRQMEEQDQQGSDQMPDDQQSETEDGQSAGDSGELPQPPDPSEGNDGGEGQNQQGEQDAEGEENDAESRPERQQPPPPSMSAAEAQRLLDALQDDEKEVLQQMHQQGSRPQRVEKDW